MKRINITALFKAAMGKRTTNQESFRSFTDLNVRVVISMMTDLGEKPTYQNVIGHLKKPGDLIAAWKVATCNQHVDPAIQALSAYDADALRVFIGQLGPLIDACLKKQLPNNAG